jgi:ATP-dependent DNA helicase RecG
MNNQQLTMINNQKTPDWTRLQKALKVEADHGFQDIQGNQYRFSEFLSLSLEEAPFFENITHLHRWQHLGRLFNDYANLTLQERQELIKNTQIFLEQLQSSWGINQAYNNQNQPPLPNLQTRKITEHIEKQNTSDQVSLEQKLDTLKTVGFRQGLLLEKLGLKTVRDLLFYYPRVHLDYTRQVNICDLEAGETVTVVGKVKRCDCFTSPKNRKLTILSIQIEDQTGKLKISRFFAGNYYTNRGWQETIKRLYPVGSIIAASGLVKENKYGLNLDNPEIEVLESDGSKINSFKIGRILPVYPLTEGLAADLIRKAVLESISAVSELEDPLPEILLNQYSFVDLQEAITQIHFPDDQLKLANARRRLIFDEFFYLQLGFLQRRQQEKDNRKAVLFNPEGELIHKFSQILPFQLTNAQERVITEILQELQSEVPMNRLVQGDVGSGKTVVAVFSILAAIQSGYQAALMAPTEVLAEQHYRKIVDWFNQLCLPVELLTGSTKMSKRKEIHAQLESGELPLLVGTHALIQDPVNFSSLGLVVIDEQHRFGVQQRARLLAKGNAPHVLTMTATPIPRTLALTLHGDLDVSQIDELPPGRQPIETKVIRSRQRNQAYELIRKEVNHGRQAYVIFPLIEESEKLDLKAAVAEYKKFSEEIFPEFQVGLLHGRMSSADKDQALNSFRDNETQIIVSTTVIEVGVDVPNTTVMLIENAERFGLSQLHQLRGRVGRGQHKSYCMLLNGSKTADAMERLSVLEQSQDGFFISEMDLRFRGPGEVLGSRQSGLPDFALASLVEDQEVLVLAREAAEKILLQDKYLNDTPSLKKELEKRYEKLLGGDILT